MTQIDAIERRRQCPKVRGQSQFEILQIVRIIRQDTLLQVVQTAEDAILFDLMWADPQVDM